MRSNKMLNKLNKIASERGILKRADLYISDVKPLDSIKCATLIGFSKGLGSPNAEEISDFIQSTFNNVVHPQMSTARVMDNDNAVYVVLTYNVPTRPASDASAMARIATNTFVEDNTGHIWTLVDAGTNKYLMRQVSENISDIISARMKHVGKDQARFASLNTKVAAPMVNSGDTVKFMSSQNVILHGVVSTVSGDNVTVSANGTSHKISRDAVLQIVDRPTESINKQKNTLKDYFSKAWGDPSLAEKFVKHLSTEEHGSGQDYIPSKK